MDPILKKQFTTVKTETTASKNSWVGGRRTVEKEYKDCFEGFTGVHGYKKISKAKTDFTEIGYNMLSFSSAYCYYFSFCGIL